MSKIIVCGKKKGGSSASSLATSLAVELQKLGSVVLVDCDSNTHTATKWNEQREKQGLPSENLLVVGRTGSVTDILRKVKSDFCVVDCGSDQSVSLESALRMADVFLLPIRPSAFDAWGAEPLLQMIKDAQSVNEKLSVLTVLTQVGVNSKTHRDAAISLLSDFKQLGLLEGVITYRQAWPSVAGRGAGITEQTADKKAISEFNCVKESVLKALGA